MTYTYANDAINLLNNTFTTSPTGLGLASNAYIQGNRLHTGVAQLNSTWSDSFSTEVRAFYKNYTRIQDPLLGRGFAQFRVCPNAVNPTGGSLTACDGGAAVVSFGPDSSRQTNALHTETWGGLVQTRLTLNNHDLRLYGEFQDVSVFNSFLQNSSGNYYFDSIADFTNRQANSLGYGNAIPSLVPDDAARQVPLPGPELRHHGRVEDHRHAEPQLRHALRSVRDAQLPGAQHQLRRPLRQWRDRQR